MVKYISFDLDGTLSNEKFDKILWNEELPKLYAEKYKTSLKDAQLHVFSEFYKALFIEKINNFTSVSYWFKRHKLEDWEKLLKDMKKHFFVYEDAQKIIPYLAKRYKLVIISSSEKAMLEVKLQDKKLLSFFKGVYSTPSDFKISMKNREAFKKLLSLLKVKEDEIVHIGDSKHMDYDTPSAIGIRAYLIDREGKHKGNHSIRSLLELKYIL